MSGNQLTHNDYSIGWICALPKEQTAAKAMLDKFHGPLSKPKEDHNAYTLGSIGKHNIVIACLPRGEMGTSSAAVSAAQMAHTFPAIKVGLLVGIGGGVPPTVKLGDVVVSTPVDQYPGIIQWDFGKAEKDGKFKRIGALNKPPRALLTALTQVESDHEMYGSQISQYLDELKERFPKLATKYTWSGARKDPLHEEDACNSGPEDLVVHYGLIASGNKVIKDANTRDEINEMLGGNVLCFEMEAAGLTDFPCLVIRGICDYADSGKNDDWQEYAAAVAAAFAKELLGYIQPNEFEGELPMKDALERSEYFCCTQMGWHGANNEAVHADITTTQGDVTYIRSEMENNDDRKILDWLTSINYGQQQSDHFKRLQPGTGEWLIDSKEFQHWLNTAHQTLFCPGIPGAGKTTLTSMIINHISSKFSSDAEIGIAYIYCSYRQQEEQETGKLLASVLRQLTQRVHPLPDSLKNLYNTHGSTQTRPSENELLEVLHLVVPRYSRVFLVIDALDECQTSNHRIINFLDKLVELQRKHGINIFATSRYIPHIVNHFRSSVSLEIRARQDDITRYINGQMDQLPNHIQANEKLQEEIRAEIVDAVDGMFLLAQIYVGFLNDKMTPNDVRASLAGFRNQRQTPGEEGQVQVLNDAYRQAMQRINSQLDGFKNLAMKVLFWTTCAMRQLTTVELQHALATKLKQSEFDDGDIPQIEDMVSVCAGLVTLDEDGLIVRPVHYTTQIFLQTTLESSYPTIQSLGTGVCISYLSFAEFRAGPCETLEEFENRSRRNPLYDYAAKHWAHHAIKDPKSVEIVMEFLQNTSTSEAASQVLMVDEAVSWWESKQNFGETLTGIHLAAYFGLKTIMKELLAIGRSPNELNNRDRSPVWYAANNGKADTLNVLLAAGADVDGSDRSTALYEACRIGSLGAVKLLLTAGADIEARSRSWEGYTPLQIAANKGHLEIIETLLAAGADVHATASQLSKVTALQVAADSGHLEIVERLLTSRAEVDALGDTQYGYTALQVAARRGHLEVVERLLAAGADVNAPRAEDYGYTALQGAAEGGWLEIVERLIAEGADLNAPASKFNYTALGGAARNGYSQIVHLLKESGALE
ncbi:unnamed protein product [Clonostachys rhizophaga]|uniref:Nucleoside phosphorylase domain-containing protein n=1 Tax=Clonostachys rhizophaga TaxID=160324 RepID=A0A9N9YNL6_9HYPO|nr:unnamed protein product [Clonostachys rhizophaga]